MNWTKLSAIGEIVSSIAILVTLGYLAVQTQQSTVAVNAQSRSTLWDFQMRLLDHVIEKPEIMASWDQSEPLTLEQKVVLGNWLFEFVGQRDASGLEKQQRLLHVGFDPASVLDLG